MNPCHHTSGRRGRRVERESAKAAGKGHREQDSRDSPLRTAATMTMFGVYAADAQGQISLSRNLGP